MNFDLTEEQKVWKKTVHDFVAKEVQPKAHEVDVSYEFNWPAVRKMGPLGLLSLNIPEEYGGASVDAISAAIAIEEIGWGCGSTALALPRTTDLALRRSFCMEARNSKKNGCPWLPADRTISAPWLLTEPGAGSDLQGGVVTVPQKMGTSGSSMGRRCGAQTLPSQNTSSRSSGRTRGAVHAP